MPSRRRPPASRRGREEQAATRSASGRFGDQDGFDQSYSQSFVLLVIYSAARRRPAFQRELHPPLSHEFPPLLRDRHCTRPRPRVERRTGWNDPGIPGCRFSRLELHPAREACDPLEPRRRNPRSRPRGNPKPPRGAVPPFRSSRAPSRRIAPPHRPRIEHPPARQPSRSPRNAVTPTNIPPSHHSRGPGLQPRRRDSPPRLRPRTAAAEDPGDDRCRRTHTRPDRAPAPPPRRVRQSSCRHGDCPRTTPEIMPASRATGVATTCSNPSARPTGSAYRSTLAVARIKRCPRSRCHSIRSRARCLIIRSQTCTVNRATDASTSAGARPPTQLPGSGSSAPHSPPAPQKTEAPDQPAPRSETAGAGALAG